MNGPHDVGGNHWMGPIIHPDNEPPFYAGWEGRMYGVTISTFMAGCLKTEEMRHELEQMPHAQYLHSNYYERWQLVIESILDRKGIVTSEEVDQRVAEQGNILIPQHPKKPENPSEMAKTALDILYNTGTPHNMETNEKAKFKVGHEVMGRNLNPRTHIRLPGYAKGKLGTIVNHYGAHGHPYDRAHGLPERAVHLYCVGFKAAVLWGEDAESPDDVVYLDLFEDYLEAA